METNKTSDKNKKASPSPEDLKKKTAEQGQKKSGQPNPPWRNNHDETVRKAGQTDHNAPDEFGKTRSVPSRASDAQMGKKHDTSIPHKGPDART